MRSQELLDTALNVTFRFIERYVAENGISPTMDEIKKGTKISGTETIYKHLDILEIEGYISKINKKSRSIKILKFANLDRPTKKVPFYGNIAAGIPIENQTDPRNEEPMEIPTGMFKNYEGDNLIALKVTGDSMIDAHITDGDIIILNSQFTAEVGEIVAVYLKEQEEITLKYWIHPSKQYGNKFVDLEPANDAFPTFTTKLTNVEIKGKLVGVFRDCTQINPLRRISNLTKPTKRF